MGNMTLEDYANSFLELMTQTQYIGLLEFCFYAGLVIGIIGVISNVINIHVFVAMGIRDGVTVCFLSLAIFDLVYLFGALSASLSTCLYVTELKLITKFKIDPFVIFIYNGHIMVFINIANTLTTTFLAVVRCLCIAKPLQFKNTVTRYRAKLFMIGIATFSITIYLPILANMGLARSSNTSRLSLWTSPNKEVIKNSIWVVTEMILPITTQIVILVCIGIMVRCLRAASSFRQTTSSDMTLDDKNNSKNIWRQNNKASDSNSSTDKLTGKDLRVIQQVVLISVVYIVCNIPKIMISLCTVIAPEFRLARRYWNIYVGVHCLRKHFDIVNAGVNLFIYCKYNAKFRSRLFR